MPVVPIYLNIDDKTYQGIKAGTLELYGLAKNANTKRVAKHIPTVADSTKESASKAIGDEDVLILKQHGVLCVGDSLKEATLLATFVEETAKTQFITYMLNSTEDLI